MLQGILFDADGVLFDSEDIYFKLVQETFKRYGVEIGRDEFIRRWMIEQTCSRGVIEDNNLEVSLEELRGVKQQIHDGDIGKELEMMPHAKELLERFKDYPYGIVTSSTRAELFPKLERFNLKDYFQVFVCGEDVSRRKPHSDPYSKGVGLLGFPADQVLVIEDNPSGVLSAKTAGCKVIAYPNGFTEGMDFSRADATVDSLAQIDKRCLKRLF